MALFAYAYNLSPLVRYMVRLINLRTHNHYIDQNRSLFSQKRSPYESIKKQILKEIRRLFSY